MSSMLSREELDALLGKGGHSRSGRPAEPGWGDRVVQAVEEAATTVFAGFKNGNGAVKGFFEATWDSFPAKAGMLAGHRLLLTECRLQPIGGTVFVATSALGALRIDEEARKVFGLENPDTFVGWQLVVKELVKEVHRNLDSRRQVKVECLPPRHWERSGRHPSAEEDLAVVEAVLEGVPAEPLFVLIPSTAEQEREAQNREAPATVGEISAGLERLADIPLAVEVSLAGIRQSIRDVASWRLGGQIVLDLVPGQTVALQANGRLLARGEVTAVGSGAVSIRITSEP